MLRRSLLTGAAALLLAVAIPAASATALELEPLKEGKSALILVVGGELTGRIIGVTADSQTIDSARQKTSLPFVKEYLLEPGRYEIATEGSAKPISLNAEAGRISLVKFNANQQDGRELVLESIRKNISISEAVEFASFLEFWHPEFKYIGYSDLTEENITEFRVYVQPIGPLPPDEEEVPGKPGDGKKLQ